MAVSSIIDVTHEGVNEAFKFALSWLEVEIIYSEEAGFSVLPFPIYKTYLSFKFLK